MEDSTGNLEKKYSTNGNIKCMYSKNNLQATFVCFEMYPIPLSFLSDTLYTFYHQD